MMSPRAATLFLAIALAAAGGVRAGDWPSWRGPTQNGVSDETGLVSTWSPGGQNEIWHAPFIGRSTPVVLHGQACVIGRVGEGIEKQEVVACFDAETGKKRWEHRFNVYHTTVAFNRVGWASLAGDPETGNLYAHGVAGQLICYDKNGKLLWSHFTTETLGRLSGYGGRTQTPLVDGDQLLITFVTSGWGDQAAPRHRYYSFDKRTGEILWIATPGGMPKDMNTQSGPVVAELDGRRLLVAGNADGSVYAVDVHDGRKIWEFKLSRRGLNSTVLVNGDVVFASHSEENLDDATMGRLVAFRGSGSGDITGQELWRLDEFSGGFPSPAFLGGKLYVVDNSATMLRVDAATGKVDWEFDLGRVGKASPVLADGKIFVPETNGRLHVIRPGADGATALSMGHIKTEDGRDAEIYGSVAVAYGRIYLSTEAGLFCIGDKDRKFRVEASPGVGRGEGKPASVQVVPAEVTLSPGETVRFRAQPYDDRGRPLSAGKAEWKMEGLAGELSESGKYTAPGGAAAQAGKVVVVAAGVEGAARVRVIPGLPWAEDFGALPEGGVPGHWIGAKGKYEVQVVDGNKVLAKLERDRGLLRNPMFMGGDFSDYTIEADVRGARVKRRMTDVGLLNSGYTLDLMGNHQRLQIRSWTAEMRMAQQVDFPWEPDVWYRMKFSVATRNGRAVLRGKVWPRDQAEPETWTLTAEDPLPVTSGSPGLTGYSPADVYYDNIIVRKNEP